MFISEECGILKVVADGGKLTRNINKRKKPDVLQAYRFTLWDKCYRQDCFFSKHMAYCESGKHDFSCG